METNLSRACPENSSSNFAARADTQVMTCPTIGEVFNETHSGTLNGGLGFDLDEAVMNGQVISAHSSLGSVSWGLYLLVDLP